MFATQWLYAIVSLIALALLYVYLVYTIPGAAPGKVNLYHILMTLLFCNFDEFVILFLSWCWEMFHRH